MIHISLSPNLQNDDVLTAVRRIFLFWEWRKKKYIKELKREFCKYFDVKKTYLFNSGRSALFVFLKSLNLKADDEIILQSFTCNAVVNPILWAGAKPIYTDIDETFNINTEGLEKHINKNTKAIVAQNTFGIPAQIDKILSIAKEHNLLVIEDCAHSLGATYKEKKVGTFGDVAFFSFGRDKVISSVYGGALIINNKILENNFLEEYKKVNHASFLWVLQQLAHPLITYIVLLTYNFGGKHLLYLAQKLKFLSKAVTPLERRGRIPKYFPRRLPDSLAALALNQFKKLDALNQHRRELARIYENNFKNREDVICVENYDRGAVWLRYPVIHSEANKIRLQAKSRGMILGDWYKEVIAPRGTDMNIVNYKAKSCKTAEYVAPKILNLPTNIRTGKLEAQEVASFIKAYSWKQRFKK